MPAALLREFAQQCQNYAKNELLSNVDIRLTLPAKQQGIESTPDPSIRAALNPALARKPITLPQPDRDCSPEVDEAFLQNFWAVDKIEKLIGDYNKKFAQLAAASGHKNPALQREIDILDTEIIASFSLLLTEPFPLFLKQLLKNMPFFKIQTIKSFLKPISKI